MAIGILVGCVLIPDGFSVGNMLTILIVVFAVIYVITMISVHRPARIAAAVSPMEALRYVPQDEMKQTGAESCAAD